MNGVGRGSRGDRGPISRGLDDARVAVRPYSKILSRGSVGSLRGRLDGRSRRGRFFRSLEAELVAMIGGSPSIAQRLLIERVIKMKWQLDLLDEKLEGGTWSAHDVRTFAGINNCLRLSLAQLERMRADGVKTPSLEAVLAAHKGGGTA